VSVGIRTVWARGHFVACPAGEPTKADFALADAPVAPPAADQVLVRNDWFSVDPYMRREFDQVVAGESVIMRSITRVTSAMMRSTSPETVGTWWISPCASPVLQIPASTSPVSYTSRPRARDQMADRRETAASSLDQEHLRDIPRNRARGDGRQDGEIKAEGRSVIERHCAISAASAPGVRCVRAVRIRGHAASPPGRAGEHAGAVLRWAGSDVSS
jgi:oxidoreductase family protein